MLASNNVEIGYSLWPMM